jgi:hypothetical protein
MHLEDLRSELREAAAVGPDSDVSKARAAVERLARRHRARRAAVAALAVAAVFAGGALALRGALGDNGQRVTSGSGEVPHLVPDYLPDSVQFVTVTDVPLIGPGAGRFGAPSRLSIYATGNGGDPLGGDSFGVEVSRLVNDGTATSAAPPTDDVTSRYLGGGIHYAGRRIGSTSVATISRQLSEDQLRQLVSSASVGADGVTLTHIDAPPGFGLVLPDATFDYSATLSLVPGTQSTGYLTVWSRDELGPEQVNFVSLSVTRGSTSDLEALRWSLADTSSVDIDGHQAVLGSAPGGESTTTGAPGQPSVTTESPPSRMIGWLRDDGTLIIVSVRGGSSDDIVQRIARSLRVVDEAQWQQFRDTPTTTLPPCQPTSGPQNCASSSGSSSGTADPATATTAAS